jgi:metal-sulfur cluster biosynthetic enzyme
MNAPLLDDAQLNQVWARLDLVMDPELDEPVTDMGFIEAVSITWPAVGQNTSTVDVTFRLPTYWCSPNFAFLMVSDIKREIETLPWVGQAVVTLHDHMAADEMNTAINSGASFGSVFSDLHPDEDLGALREKFDVKAFQRRQEVVIKALVSMGFLPAEITTMPRALLEATDLADPEAARQKARYLAIVAQKNLAPRLADLAFPTYQGEPIADYAAYMGLLRSVRINMEFSGSLCRGLKRSRYMEADLSGDVPVLVDFTTQTHNHACR